VVSPMSDSVFVRHSLLGISDHLNLMHFTLNIRAGVCHSFWFNIFTRRLGITEWSWQFLQPLFCPWPQQQRYSMLADSFILCPFICIWAHWLVFIYLSHQEHWKRHGGTIQRRLKPEANWKCWEVVIQFLGSDDFYSGPCWDKLCLLFDIYHNYLGLKCFKRDYFR